MHLHPLIPDYRPHPSPTPSVVPTIIHHAPQGASGLLVLIAVVGVVGVAAAAARAIVMESRARFAASDGMYDGTVVIPRIDDRPRPVPRPTINGTIVPPANPPRGSIAGYAAVEPRRPAPHPMYALPAAPVNPPASPARVLADLTTTRVDLRRSATNGQWPDLDTKTTPPRPGRHSIEAVRARMRASL